MKRFLERYSYSIVRMFVDQIALAVFGMALATACGAMAANGQGDRFFQWIVGAFSVLFYLFLIYILVWEVGSKDRISVDCGKLPARPWYGIVLGLAASTVNLLLAVLTTIGQLIPALSGFGGVCRVIALFLQGMYMGLLTIRIGDVPLNNMWWTYFIIVIPLVVASFLAYFAGYHNFRILPQPKKKK